MEYNYGYEKQDIHRLIIIQSETISAYSFRCKTAEVKTCDSDMKALFVNTKRIRVGTRWMPRRSK